MQAAGNRELTQEGLHLIAEQNGLRQELLTADQDRRIQINERITQIDQLLENLRMRQETQGDLEYSSSERTGSRSSREYVSSRDISDLSVFNDVEVLGANFFVIFRPDPQVAPREILSEEEISQEESQEQLNVPRSLSC